MIKQKNPSNTKSTTLRMGNADHYKSARIKFNITYLETREKKNLR